MSRAISTRRIESVSNDETQKLAAAMERLRKSMKLMIDKYFRVTKAELRSARERAAVKMRTPRSAHTWALRGVPV